MKLNPDCCRSVLLAVEEKSYGKVFTLSQLVKKLPDYSGQDVAYSCLKLYEAGFLDVAFHTSEACFAGYSIARIHDITYDGHEFLENVRNDGIWKDAKEKAKGIGSLALSALSKAAANLIASHFSS